MVDEKLKDELKLAAGWNPPAGLVWRAEPPDKLGRWWWMTKDRKYKGVCYYSQGVIDALSRDRSHDLVWAGPIPEPTDGPADPDEALAAAAESLRANGLEWAANVAEALAGWDERTARVAMTAAATLHAMLCRELPEG